MTAPKYATGGIVTRPSEPENEGACEIVVSAPLVVKGLCSVCARPFKLKKDGTLHVHGKRWDIDDPWTLCPGSGKAPVAT